MIGKLFNRNSYIFGAIFGIICPILTLAAFYFVFHHLFMLLNIHPLEMSQLYLLSLITNIFFIRYYLINKKMEHTGKSIVLVTFLIIVLFFIFK